MGEVLALSSAFCFGLSNVFVSKAIAKTDRNVGLLTELTHELQTWHCKRH